MAKVLLLGSNGWIGKQLIPMITYRDDVKILYHSDVRVDDIEKLSQEIDSLQPTHIISTIGRTHGVIDGKIIPTIDYLEYPGKLGENIRDNLFSPMILAKLCDDKGIHLTYLGTGCIFEYDGSHAFDEEAKPNFFGSSYSIVKGFTDQLMTLYSKSVLNVRIRMPITSEPNPRDFITKIVGYEKICSMANSMTVLDELLPIMVDMAINKKVGTINLTNPGTISHEEILQMYKEIVDPNITWKTMTYEEQSNLLKSKRSNNELDTSKLVKWYPEVSDIKKAVFNVLKKRIEE
jgi:nucleoside-diphosphate-sugar epimerase